MAGYTALGAMDSEAIVSGISGAGQTAEDQGAAGLRMQKLADETEGTIIGNHGNMGRAGMSAHAAASVVDARQNVELGGSHVEALRDTHQAATDSTDVLKAPAQDAVGLVDKLNTSIQV